MGRPAAGARPGGGGAAAAAVDKAPTFRVPGASVAAKAMQAGGAGLGSNGGAQRQGDAACTEFKAPKASPLEANRAASTDAAGVRPSVDAKGKEAVGEDGFQTVRRRGWRKARDSRAVDGKDDDASDAEDLGRERSERAGTQHADGDGGDAEGGGEAPPTPNTLHRAWQDEVAMVRRLRKQGVAQGHPAMQAACAARDSAERTWRDAKDPAPTAVRLARAQAKLDRAMDIQAETRQALLDYEEQHRQKLAALHSRLDEDRARVRLRRQQLESVQAEVGAEGRGARAREKQSEAVRRVHSSLCGTVAPTIAALVEQLDSSTPAWSVLNGLLGTLSESKSALEGAFHPSPGTQRFDIAEGDGAVDVDEGSGGEWEEESQWSESHDLHARDAGVRNGGGQGLPTAAATPAAATPIAHAGSEGADGEDQCMGTENWWDSASAQSWGPAARWQECSHGKWARTSWAESWEQEQEDRDLAAEQPAAARRRLEDAPAAMAIGGGAKAADEQAAIAERKRQHEKRVQGIVLAAIDAGVQPLTTEGEELHLLDPHRLDEWVAANLPAVVPTR